MKCPMCQQQARRVREVKHGTDPDGWSVISRERVCQCGHHFITFECYEYADVEVVFRARDVLADVNAAVMRGDTVGALAILESAAF